MEKGQDSLTQMLDNPTKVYFYAVVFFLLFLAPHSTQSITTNALTHTIPHNTSFCLCYGLLHLKLAVFIFIKLSPICPILTQPHTKICNPQNWR